MRHALLPLLLCSACAPDWKVEGEVSDDSVTGPDEELEELWAGATLEILSPASGEFLPWGEVNTFEAVVYDSAGVATDFAEIGWASNADSAWAPVGALVEDEAIGVGEHNITATALLPNGDRLSYTIGGVLVQSPYAGTYVGDIQVDVTVEYDGTPYEVGCTGALTVLVDAYGETATGESTCQISLLGYDVEIGYVLDLENDEGELGGDASAVIWGYDYTLEFEGELTEDGELTGVFSGDDSYFALDGTVEASRLTRDIAD